MTPSRRTRGEVVLWRSIHDGRPGFVTPHYVVEDTARTIAIFQPSGVTVKNRVGKRGGPRGRNLLPDGWDGTYEDAVWDGPGCLRVHVPGTAYSVWRWWDSKLERYEGWDWYVNLELPWRRTSVGFDSRDLLLDVVITEDLSSWEWKDEDELEWALDVGVMDPETAALTRAAGEQALTRLEQRAFPFGEDWDQWRPDPSWGIPTMSADWAEV